jgi:hypothetical protein
MVGFIPSVTRDNGNFARAAVGQTVTAFQTPTATASDITPGVTAPNDGDQVLTPFSVSITKARRVPIRWNGEETLGLNNAGAGQAPIFVQQTMQAFRTLANEMEADLANAAIRTASRASGTAGTTPFGTAADLSDFAATARILDDNGAPMGDRHMVLSGAAMQNIRGKQSVLFKVNEAGTDQLLRQGVIGQVEGFGLHYAPQIPLVTKGTGTGYLVNNASNYAIGATAIAVDTGTGTINPGDVVTFAGDSTIYAVDLVNGTTTLGQTPTSITLGGPGLRAALLNNVALTVGGSYTPTIAFSRDALLLATRLPALAPGLPGQPAGDMADDRTTVFDPFSGLTFEISVYRQYRQTHFEVGIVWGVAGIKSDHIALLLG